MMALLASFAVHAGSRGVRLSRLDLNLLFGHVARTSFEEIWAPRAQINMVGVFRLLPGHGAQAQKRHGSAVRR